ncbi:hypothetical protein IGI04_036091 [Brassica rapa subsp. trilocularis]|uniref:DUF4283 domain-containing protein n=1 Tax=Brassica rapa subsp. trilocularis TaxID=1813537 RepID=A0ABQ7LHC3_BRACM|nr:hypothetical protein IGI04_036091 [Brassica rapa subsp. trilocularis]
MDKEEPMSSFSGSAKETVRAAILRFPKNFDRCISFVLQHTARILRGVRKIWNIIGIPLNLDLPKLLNVLYMDRVNYYAVQWLGRRTQEFEPINILWKRWQQLTINKVVGYDTIIMNSLQNSAGQGRH